VTESSTPSPIPKAKKPLVAQSGDGLVVSWKLLSLVVAALASGGGLWAALGIATSEDVEAHDASAESHEVVVENHDADLRAHPVPGTNKGVVEIVAEQQSGYIAAIRVKSAFDDFRAEELADRAADKVTDPRQSREVWKSVKARAKANLEAEPPRPVREGLEPLLE
jgi:hypothetical protein